MLLSTVTKLKQHMNLPVTDLSKNPKLEMLLSGASRFIEGQCARKLELQAHSLKMDGDDTDMLMLPHYPILVSDGEAAITVLKVDGISILDEIASGEVDVDAAAGILYRRSGTWRKGRRNIEVGFSAGYVLPGSDESGLDDASTVPEDLELAAIRLAARVYERSTAEGTTSVSPSSYSVTFKDAIDDEIKATIGRYSRMRVS